MRRKILRWSALRPFGMPLVIFTLLLVYSCGGNQMAEVAPATGTGSVAFTVKWEPPPAFAPPGDGTETAVRPLAPVDICTVISTIELQVWRKGPPDTSMPQRATCLCTDNSAKLSGIDAGIENLYVRIWASPGDWVGESVLFKLNPGEDKNLGVISVTQLNLGVAAPTFSPASGTYTTAQTVTLETTTPGAPIRYTTDGSMPSDTVGTVYSSPISVSSSVTILAVAYLPGGASSVVSSATYTISGTVASPTFSPAPGTYATAQSVTLSTATSGATIRYTTDGTTTPSDTVGTLYTAPFSVSSSVTIKAVAYKAGSTTSSVVSGAFTITPPASTTGVWDTSIWDSTSWVWGP